MRLVLLALALLTFTYTPSQAADLAAEGRRAVEKAQCHRCHDVTGGLADFKREMHCVNCHTWILGTKGNPEAIARQRQDFPDWDRYLESVVHFTRLPDLGTLARRVRPASIRRFLDAPHDLRPHLDETMIPLRLSAREKDAVVAWLTKLAGPQAAIDPPDAPAPGEITADRVAAGRETFLAKGCTTCHVVGAQKLHPGQDAAFYRAVGEAARLAPDLRHVRDRVPREVLVRFVQDPQAVDPSVTMPKMGVSPAEAERLADFLLGADPGPAPAVPAAPPDVPVLAREVPFDEVFDEVLGRICVHCHMDPATNAGDGGAGNTGGLGFAGLKLSLESYPSVKRGLVRDGKRVSVVEPGPDGAPPMLLQALLRRHEEAGRTPDPTHPGMPLGLPPLSVTQMSLVKTWLAQGAQGPR